MQSTGHALMDAMVAPLQSYVQQCPPAPLPPVRCNVAQLQRKCNPDNIDELLPAPGDPPIAMMTKCNTPCSRLLLQDGMFEACIASQEAAGIGGFEIFEPLVDACNLLEEDEECIESLDEMLTTIGGACGCPDGAAMGGRDSACDAGPARCSSDCSDQGETDTGFKGFT
jgi:hypothetical protein